MQGQDTFRFLENSGGGIANAKNAAQNYLSKSKYGSVSDPSNPYSMGEGIKPTGEMYDDQRVVTNQAEIDAAKAKNAAGGGGLAGELSAEEIRDRFGFEYNEEHAKQKATSKKGDHNEDTGAIYSRATGEYIGTVPGYGVNKEGRKSEDGDGYNREDDGVMAFQKKMESYAESNDMYDKGKGDKVSNWNSLGDVTKTANIILGEGKSTDVPEPEYETKAIEHSDEIRQAKERVQNWERSVEDGSMSDSIFKNQSLDSFDPGDMSVPGKSYGTGQAQAEDKYNFDATKGASGIGTQDLSLGAKSSNDAAAAFVNDQISNTKKKFNLQPAS